MDEGERKAETFAVKLVTAISSREIAWEVMGSATCLKTETNLCAGERKRLKVNKFKKPGVSSGESPDNSKVAQIKAFCYSLK